MFYRSTSTFIMGVSAVVKWISHYILSHTLSPILFPNKGSSVCVEMKICILFINNNGALVASLQKRKKKSHFPFSLVSLPNCGAHSEGEQGGWRYSTNTNRMRSFFQDAHTALTLTLHITESGQEKEMPISASSLETSHKLVHQAAGLYNFLYAFSNSGFAKWLAQSYFCSSPIKCLMNIVYSHFMLHSSLMKIVIIVVHTSY